MIRCLLTGHVLGGLVRRGSRVSVRCLRCDRISPGIVIDGPRPKVTQPVKTKARTWWLRGVFSKSS